MRVPRTYLLWLVVLALVLVPLGGCGDSGSSADSSNGTESGGATEADLDAFKQAAEEAYGEEPWFGRIVEWRLTTMLGADTLAVMTDLEQGSDDEQQYGQAIADALAGLDPVAPNIDVRSQYPGLYGTGWTQAGAATTGGTPMAEAYDLPEVPMSGLEMEIWMEGVYSPGALVELGPDETWYDSIESISWEPTDASEEDVIVVRTTMTPEDVNAEDLQFYILNLALNTTGSPLLRYYQVLGPDDEMLDSVASGGGEPGQGGPNYW